MRKTYLATGPLQLANLATASFAQGNLVPQTLDNPRNEPAPVFPIPSDRQRAWQETEFYAFYHYGMNTFRNYQNGGDYEWGYGDEDPLTYAPTELPNCLQWIQTAKAAHMKGGIAVVKHHDGFCLWPTATTDHCVTNSGGVGPSVDLPALFSQASEQEGVKYGFYVSPWDRNNAHYGKPEYVKDVFLRQYTELAQYGNAQFEMWFDGANGGSRYYGGANETRSINAATYYDTPNLANTIHKLQPNCVIWGGTGARWVGNEAGYAPIENWSNQSENGWKWLPTESDAKATTQGWFWNEGEGVLSAERLFQIYLETVGRNATLILNIPPNKYGVLPDATVNSMEALGTRLDNRLTNDLAQSAKVSALCERSGGFYAATCTTDGDKESYWTTDDDITSGATLTFTWAEPQTVHYVILQEYLPKGQRIKSFLIGTSADGETFTPRATDPCKTVGYKRIVPLDGNTTSYGSGYSVKALRITLIDSRACPLLHTVSVY